MADGVFLLVEGADPIPVDDGAVVLVGRGQEALLALEDKSVSRRHCAFTRSGLTLSVRDLGSKTGTLVNGAKVAEVALSDGDAVTVGPFTIQIKVGAAPAAPSPPPQPLGKISEILGAGAEADALGKKLGLVAAALAPAALAPAALAPPAPSPASAPPPGTGRLAPPAREAAPAPPPMAPPTLIAPAPAGAPARGPGGPPTMRSPGGPAQPTPAPKRPAPPKAPSGERTTERSLQPLAAAPKAAPPPKKPAPPKAAPKAAAPPPPPPGRTLVLCRDDAPPVPIKPGTVYTIGRQEGCEVRLEYHDVSRRHAEVRWTPEGLSFTDLGSLNKLVVGDARLDAAVIPPGGRIGIGPVELWVEQV